MIFISFPPSGEFREQKLNRSISIRDVLLCCLGVSQGVYCVWKEECFICNLYFYFYSLYFVFQGQAVFHSSRFSLFVLISNLYFGKHVIG